MEKSPTPAELVEAARRRMPHMRILEANEKESHRLAAMILAGIPVENEQASQHVIVGIPNALKELSRSFAQRQRAIAWSKTSSPEIAALTQIVFEEPEIS